MIRPALSALLLALAPPALAQQAAPGAEVAAEAIPDEVRALAEALKLRDIVALMAAEGVADAEALAAEIFRAGPPPSTWDAAVAAIYDPEDMAADLLAGLAEGLEGADTAAILAFFESEPGRTMIAREVETREALADEDAEREAREAAAVAMAEESPRLALLHRYVEALDLVEFNVVGALNSNYAYVSGLLDGGALGDGTTEGEILSDISSQEPQIRADTAEWVLAFLLEAYEPLSDSDLEALIAFSETEDGRILNQALFDAFDRQFVDISRALGLTAARYMTTEAL